MDSSSDRANHNGGRSALLLALLLPVLAAISFASPIAARDRPEEDAGLVLRADRGYYKVYEDGRFVIGGDVIGSCDTVLQEILQGPLEPSQETYRQVEVCTRAGFPPPGAESLPETGGPPLAPIIAAALLLLGGALCSLGVRR